MKKLLVICGPTATGKTGLALSLARKFDGELISADSRQVYKGMDIGTGKDLPKNSKFQNSKTPSLGGFYTINSVKVWGYDLVEPAGEFSVGQYVQFANRVIGYAWKRGKLPILVGGTGLYIRGVTDGISTSQIPKNEILRKSLQKRNAAYLFDFLARLDAGKAASMNASDRKNPRRLIRAIEIASARIKRGKLKAKSLNAKILFVGLKASRQYLDKKVDERVEKRIKQGIEKEIKGLFKKGVTWKHQSMQALGYKQWKSYFENKEAKAGVILDWKKAERKYLKRQITWFKREKRINWFDISKVGWKKGVEKRVKEWHNLNDK